MNRKAFLACVLMCVILTGCETAKKISEVIKNPDTTDLPHRAGIAAYLR